MKHMKKLIALAIALVMCMAMGVPAFAYNLTVNSEDTHTYDVYQILTGDLSTDGKTLSNVAWGSSAKTQTDGKINGKTATEFAKFVENLSGNALVEEVAKYFTVGTGKVNANPVTKDAGLTNLAAGYYVMVDSTNPLDKNDTKALNVIQVLNDVTVTKKWNTTSDTKVIDTDTLGKSGTETNSINGDDDNVSIGDTVNYKITAHVPANTDKYKEGTFYFVITDKLSSGLTFTDGSIKVYKGSVADANKLADTAYTVKTTDIGENTFEIALKNAGTETYRDQDIIVTYSAVVNNNAVIGNAGNPNESTVKFSNDPNKTYDGTTDSDGDGFPDSTSDVPMGETPKTETKTYVTGIEILKVNENGEPLQGAAFTLTGDSTKIVVTKTETFAVDDEKGTYYKLKNGTYTMVAPTAENTMIAAEAGATKGYVVDANASGNDVITIGETKYRPVQAGETPTHILKEGSADAYADNHKYVKTVAVKTATDAKTSHSATETVDANGLARFDGLGAGEYTLTESTTPNGYNTISPITLTISYPTNDDINDVTTAKFSVTGGNATYEDGVVKVRIVNKKGAELPSTGGIGTTIFYIVGAILVLGAGVLLVTRRRMSAN